MSALDAATQAWLDQEDRHTVETIRKYGTYIQYVGGAGQWEVDRTQSGSLPFLPVWCPDAKNEFVISL